jgi:mono/diheme cytochrome c family protein
MAKSFFSGGVHTRVLYRNHITLLTKQFNRRNALFSKGLWQFQLWGLYCNFAGQGFYRETIYSLLGEGHEMPNGKARWRNRMQRPIERDVLKKSGNVIIGHHCPGRWTNKIALIFAIVFALWVAHALAQGPKQTDLKEFYQQNCARCHGPDGSAVSADGKKLHGQDFTDKDWQRNTGDKEMVKTILTGKFFGLAMPKFKDALTEQEARWIVTDIIRNSKKGQVIAPEVEDRTSK